MPDRKEADRDKGRALDRAALYLRYSEYCVMLAARASEPEDNSRLLEMARAWEALGKELIEGAPKSYN